jgi:hypothetical protein
MKQLPKPGQSLFPEANQREKMAVTGCGERRRSFLAGLDALLEKSLHLGDEYGAGELIG